MMLFGSGVVVGRCLSPTPIHGSQYSPQRAEIKNALAIGETAGRFDYHKSMELTGLS
ncbi:hypothetical protein PANT111_170186 [Pantoea brenneri]|uniref:Uncharacterized protein n=1 Tax=Pantoea brenneri TaxID=472694 RepID=A0AAX3J5J3_9GAMM|nr:hypothetical protein PANT111_170186 [Pantoea brenneri]